MMKCSGYDPEQCKNDCKHRGEHEPGCECPNDAMCYTVGKPVECQPVEPKPAFTWRFAAVRRDSKGRDRLSFIRETLEECKAESEALDAMAGKAWRVANPILRYVEVRCEEENTVEEVA